VFGDFETHGWPFLQEWVARLSIAMGCGLLAGMGVILITKIKTGLKKTKEIAL
jgi:hypothetical protein